MIGNRLRIEALLGSGAMAEVYRAMDERSGQRVAVKRHVGSGDERNAALLRAQFEREYYWLRQLAHPRIVEVYDFILDPEGACYSMELLDGQDLRERGRLDWREACVLMLDLASSLAILHARGLLHRDLSPSNVRYGTNGRAKLIDFGAMALFGPASTIIGTPPYTAPEVLQFQALDARADLYALGALAYWVLTGRTAYPARAMNELTQAWANPPPPLALLQPDVPEALERLVMELLQLQRSARPTAAAEVMARLSAIAGLPYEEIEVGRAYLITPRVIGRGLAQQAVKQQTAAAQAGLGACVFIEGAAGSGRSRVLDLCVLDAQLMGAMVLRADAGCGASASYAVACKLAGQLLSEHPRLPEHQTLPAEVLAYVRPDSESVPHAPNRHTLLGALCDWIWAIARNHLVAIAVDDVDAIDEPSAALLGLLAPLEKHGRLVLLLCAETRAPLSAALSGLRSDALCVACPALELHETRELVNSLFGAELSFGVVQQIHQLSEGIPRLTMAVCEWLVEHHIARYESGSWTVPRELAPDQLPRSMHSELATRVASLGADARELAQALCLTDPSLLSIADYAGLTEHADHQRIYRAVDELTNSGVIAPSGDRYRFRRREFVELLASELDDTRRRGLHACITRALEHTEQWILLAHHTLLAGDVRGAVARLASLHGSPRDELSALSLSVVRAVVDAARTAGLPALEILPLELAVAGMASTLGEYAVCVGYAVPLLQRLAYDSGLADYEALHNLPSAERLTRAFSQAQQRYDTTPQAARGLPVVESISALARLSFAITSLSHSAFDLDLLERLPELAPFAALSPALLVLELTKQATRTFLSGRFEDAPAVRQRVVARLDEADGGGLAGRYRKVVRMGMLYSQGLGAAGLGRRDAATLVAPLDDEPGHRANAWRVRMLTALMQGDAEAALECRRRAEQLQLQDTGQVLYSGTTARVEMLAHIRAGDHIGVVDTLQRLHEISQRFPNWKVDYLIACCHDARLRGDFSSALAAVGQALALVRPGRHPDWATAAAAHILTLNDALRFEESAQLGCHYLETHEREHLSGALPDLLQPVAEALAKVGRVEQATEFADHCIAIAVQRDAKGLLLGRCYETRARVALAAGDEATFHEFAERCAGEYQLGKNRSLTNRYEQLIRESDRRGWLSSRKLAALVSHDGDETQTLTTISRLLESSDDNERLERGLRLLLAGTSALSGYLFGLQRGRLRLLARIAAAEPSEELLSSLQSFLADRLDQDSTVTQAMMAEPSAPDATLDVEPLLLSGNWNGEEVVAGVAALIYDTRSTRRVPDRRVISALMTSLLRHVDTEPIAYRM